ncbi:isoleucine--tRNA ligase [Desulfofundulus thermobenzoicus]|uniref:Isoleucine--tRNA ligase n=1 Tax=Desulfofundulus thermobenzoicus TaxID=29376 RepID=A0A6N7ISR1_9FIRM|nr:isoleucine--tRNA ligase [Desulfofundulus thermobenzoicus]MQL53156.1 isoleucine--tRNA ligase [Desulfofundulus thermobenzoicus]HHW44795.1 isoleucine--tRNA ligase [Desulfotomaculum sp.]
MDYSQTLNLPKTDFPMRANLPQREPEILKFWEEIDLYRLVQQKNTGRPKFILHDGPPYANGHIHLGHVLNKVLKDMVVKYHSMAGYDAPYVPGWDTHGLPIEQQAIKNLGLNRHAVHPVEFRRRCKEYALKFVDIQREEFKRLGVRGDWNHPYLTLMPHFEAAQIGVFGEMARRGYIYKGLKPVYWCATCETALAEAEVEYQEKQSPSIYVRFPVKDGKGVLPAGSYVVIWTTTPWTLIANVAVCLHPDYAYGLFSAGGEKYLVAMDLWENFSREVGLQESVKIKEFTGRELEGVVLAHPFFQRDSLLILGEHVTLEAGTGCVHTAPGHGHEDYLVGQRYGLPILSPIDSRGRFTAEAGPFAGQFYTDANRSVMDTLQDNLLKAGTIRHQYPHCWRCKKPVFFRATEQWFASIEGFRSQALEAIRRVRWIPAWGEERIHNMVANRGDWCISRQRTWGVPIPIFYCAGCGKEIVTAETISHLQALFREHGSDVWFAREAADLVPPGFKCPYCGAAAFRKETDIMDVWFDSGSSHMGVLEQPQIWPELRWPADLYLEGSDQHRGWFNSSLSTAVAVRGRAPYRAVLTHGFVVDEQGRKMSKSLGNVVDPLKVIQQMGADILRLWVSSADYRGDLAVSPGILKQMAEAYRKIRNTIRFLLGNLYDFNPEKDPVAYKELPELDRWALLRLHRLIARVLDAYRDYEYHVVYHAIHTFCTVDMSALYLDIIKDRLYCAPAASAERRAAQTVLYQVLHALVRLLAPVLAFTTEEIWRYAPKEKDAPVSVQLTDMPRVNEDYLDVELEERWERLLAVRGEVTRALEAARREKVIGNSLEAAVIIYARGDLHDFLAGFADLPVVFIVSAAELKQWNGGLPEKALISETVPGLAVLVEKAPGEKCPRCWMYHPDVGRDEEQALCPRCAGVVGAR